MESDQTDTGIADQKESQSSHTTKTETESKLSETSQAAATTPNKIKRGPQST